MAYTGNNKQQQGIYTVYSCGQRGEACQNGWFWRFRPGQIKSERLMGYCMSLPHAPAWYSIEGNQGLEVLETWDPKRANDSNVVFRLKKEEHMENLSEIL